MNEETHYQKNKEIILTRAKNCYENDRERLREQARNKHRNLSEEEKINRENMDEPDILICLMKINKS